MLKLSSWARGDFKESWLSRVIAYKQMLLSIDWLENEYGCIWQCSEKMSAY